MKQCIGLFGTCGTSTWRRTFMELYKDQNIDFFNPMVDDWKPEDAIIEAEHLAEDNIILFPITGETYGVGSIAEVGFGVLSAAKLEDRRDFVVMIEMELSEELMKDADRAKESLRARALVLEHLKAQNLPNVYLVDNLTTMYQLSIVLEDANNIKESISRYSVKNK